MIFGSESGAYFQMRFRLKFLLPYGPMLTKTKQKKIVKKNMVRKENPVRVLNSHQHFNFIAHETFYCDKTVHSRIPSGEVVLGGRAFPASHCPAEFCQPEGSSRLSRGTVRSEPFVPFPQRDSNAWTCT